MALSTTVTSAVAVQWEHGKSRQGLLEAEKYVCCLQRSLQSQRLRHEVAIAVTQGEGLLEMVARKEENELKAGARVADDTSDEWMALLDQRTPSSDLYSAADTPELKVWGIVEQVHATLSRSDTLYGETLYASLHPKVTELISRVARLLPRTKLHSVELSDIVSNSLSQAVRFASAASFEDAVKPVVSRLKEHASRADALQDEVESSLREGDTEEAEGLVKQRLQLLQEMLQLISCKYDAATAHAEQLINTGRVEVEQVCGGAVHEAERLTALNAMRCSNVEHDTKALNQAMSSFVASYETEEGHHKVWLAECDQRLHDLKVKSNDAWDRIAEHEALLKTYAEERLSLVEERLQRSEKEMHRRQEKQRLEALFAERTSVLKLNRQCLGHATECYGLCSTIALDVKAKLLLLLDFVSDELGHHTRLTDAEYDRTFRTMHTALSDLVYRKNALISSLEFDIEANQAEGGPTKKTDDLRARVSALAQEVQDLDVSSKASLLLYDRLVGHRLKEERGADWVPPQADASSAITLKRDKLKRLMDEQARDKEEELTLPPEEGQG